MEKISNYESQNYFELNEILKEDNTNNDLSKNELYICFLVFIIFILTFSMTNDNDNKFNKKINAQLEENFLTNLKRYVKKDALKEPKVGLCIIGKKENKYAKEYVEHYKSIGFNHMFIYDNNDKDDERFEEVLSEDISKNFVSIINFRNIKDKRPQFEAYRDCYEKNSKEYDWLAFYDFDEFLYLKKHKTIQEFVKEDKFNNCSNIKINWITYSDNDLIYYENKPVQERFTTPLYENGENIHIKSLVKGHLSKNYWIDTRNPHSGINDYPCCIPTGEKIDSSTPFNIPPNYDFAYINHHSTKSLEEFIEKTKRGYPDHTVVISPKYWKNRFEYFFSKNKKTKEKIDYIKKVLNIDIN